MASRIASNLTQHVSATADRAYDVDVVPDLFVPMSDGIRLSARLYRPMGLQRAPVLLTVLPYLKDGWGGAQMEPYQRRWVGRGYACVQLDIRGIGSSEGRSAHFMDYQERLDAAEAVEWIAAQPWCSGAVGMWGLSYGAVTAITTASMQPPHLRAIVPICGFPSARETYRDHRGARLMFNPGHFMTRMAATILLPPLRSTGPDWHEVWRQRLESNSPWALDVVGEPQTPGHWERVSVDPSLITTPVFSVGGWWDSFIDEMIELTAAAQGPRRILIGPWKHLIPDTAPTGSIDILREIDRWWDRWLRDESNGAEREPRVTYYVQGTGEWRQESEWPPARAAQRCWQPAAGRTLVEGSASAPATGDGYRYDPVAGLAGIGYHTAFVSVPIPLDQSADDRRSLTYTTDALSAPVEVTGQPVVQLSIRTDALPAELNLVAKLVDVSPDGMSALVSAGHCGGVAAERQSDGSLLAKIDLRATSYVFESGHRIRISLGGADFPILWPTPTLYSWELAAGTELQLPVAPPAGPDVTRTSFAPGRPIRPPSLVDGSGWFKRVEPVGPGAFAFEGERFTTYRIDPAPAFATSMGGGLPSMFRSAERFSLTVEPDHPERARAIDQLTLEIDRPTSAVRVAVETVRTWGQMLLSCKITLDGSPLWEKTWRKHW